MNFTWKFHLFQEYTLNIWGCLFNVSVTDTRIQEEESLDLSKEIFALLNNCNPENSSVSLVMTTIVQWLQSSPRSILLMPCVRVASRCLASHKHIVNIVEECIHVYFKGGMKTQKPFIFPLFILESHVFTGTFNFWLGCIHWQLCNCSNFCEFIYPYDT